MDQTDSDLSPGGPPPAGFTADDFLGGRISVLQPEKGFRAGIDSVLLAAAVPARPGEAVFEAGTGTGVAALCLAARVPDVTVTGVELAQRHVLIAERNAARNAMQARLRLLHGDIRDFTRRDRVYDGIAPESFGQAFANPPFFEEGRHQPSPNPLKAAAHGLAPGDLELWVKAMHLMLASRGTLTLIHLPESLPVLLAAMENRFGAIVAAPIFARPGVTANRVILQAVKGSRAPLRLHPGLVLMDSANVYSPAAEAILRDAAPWPLS